jgi:hypothetical protein
MHSMKKLLYTLTACLSFMACKKTISADEPEVSVSLTNARSTVVDTLVFQLGDSCKFNIDGYADNMTFWAGNIGNNYDFRNRTQGFGKMLLSFTSTAANGSQANTLKVLAMTNLKSLDSATVYNAAWTDITARTALATSATAVSTGTVDITDLVGSPSDSLFLAFRYAGTTGSTQRTWVINNLVLNNTGADFNYPMINIVSDVTYWTVYGNVWAPSGRKWIPSSSMLTIGGGDATQPTNVSWIVSKPLYVSRLAPDVPTTVLKNLTAASPSAYQYRYAAPGLYKASFVSYNNTIDNTKTTTKVFWIRVI